MPGRAGGYDVHDLAVLEDLAAAFDEKALTTGRSKCGVSDAFVNAMFTAINR